MINENLSVAQVLDWYCVAGVDATLDDVPFAKTQTKSHSNFNTPVAVNQSLPNVQKSLHTSSPANPFAASDDSSAVSHSKSTPVQETVTRPAMTDLAQDTLNACANAANLCKKAASLEELLWRLLMVAL